jgi:small subunit ribosomal protein S1
MVASFTSDLPEAVTMEQLLEEAGDWNSLKPGQIVEGEVARADSEGILISFGGKSEGLVAPEEMRSLSLQVREEIRVGDSIRAFVLRPDTEYALAVLSLDMARSEEGWETLEHALETNEVIAGKVVGQNRGGLLVDVGGVQGFVPISHLAPETRRSIQEGEEAQTPGLEGEELRLKVLELERSRNRAVLSERMAWQELRQEQKQKLLQELKEGDVRTGLVTGVSSFGAFVDLGGADGLIHISEMAWNPVASPGDVVQVGKEVQVYVLKVDAESGRISLSLRRLQSEPWDTVAASYQEGQIVTGTITNLVPFGAFVRLEGDLQGLIHISELSDRHVVHPREVLKEGDVLELKIVKIDAERKRLGLSLKQAVAES